MASQGASSVNVKVGDRVVVLSTGLPGQVKFIGQTKFYPGIWIGIRLDEAVGKNDGSVNGVSYFSCPPNCGIFVKPENLVKERRVVTASTATKRNSGVNSGLSSTSPRTPRKGTVGDDIVVSTAPPELFTAAKNVDDLSELQTLVEKDGIAVTGTDKFGNTCLHILAAQAGGSKTLAALQYLIEKGLGTHINDRNIYGHTAVMIAAAQRRWDIMEYLVSIGGDVIYKGPSDTLDSVWDSCHPHLLGMKALHIAMEKQKEAREKKEIGPLISHKPTTLVQALFKTAFAGDLHYVCMLIEEYKVDVNSVDKDGNTTLHWIAPDAKRLPMMKYLVSAGIKIEPKNKAGDTPCLVAARSRNWFGMQYLVSLGASISTVDAKNGKNVYDYAQANLTSRRALAEALEERKKNGIVVVEQADEEALENEAMDQNEHNGDVQIEVNEPDEYANTEEVMKEIEEHNKHAQKHAETAQPPSLESKKTDPSIQQSQAASKASTSTPAPSSTSKPATIAPASAPAPTSKPAPAPAPSPAPAPVPVPVPNNEDLDVPVPASPSALPEVPAAVAPVAVVAADPPVPKREVTTVGNFSAVITGKKKNKLAGKVCMVNISESGIEIQYKKGSWFTRKDMVEHYEWSDQISMKKVNETTLKVDLNPTARVSLVIAPCQPDALEEFIWKNIWRKVFEISVNEAKQLLDEYEHLCKATTETLQQKTSARADLTQHRSMAQAQQDSKALVDIALQMDALDLEITELTSRFAFLREKGENLQETFNKMNEALERRVATEEARKKEFIAYGKNHRVEDINRGELKIKQKMALVEADQARVVELLAQIRQMQLSHSKVARPASTESSAEQATV